jgi:hypothetical protein
MKRRLSELLGNRGRRNNFLPGDSQGFMEKVANGMDLEWLMGL